MKKVLIITLEFPPHLGGIASYVSQMAAQFDPEKTIVLAPKLGDTSVWDSVQKYTTIRRELLFPVFFWPRWIKMFFIVRKIVKQEKIEIILVHHVLPVGYIAWMMKKIMKVPYLVFSHGTDLLMGTRTGWKKRMTRMINKSAEAIIFNSESLKRRFIQILPEFETKSHILYPCPSTAFFEKPSEDILERLRSQLALHGKKVMLSVSRLGEGKGFPHLLRMLPEILQKEPNLVWIVVGDGPKKAQFIKDLQAKSLQNVVRFIGGIQHDELVPYFYLADLFVLLTHPDETRGEEGLGLVFLEAAAARLPVVAGRSGGVEEAVLHGETGFVFDIYTQQRDIVEAVAQLVHTKEYGMELGKRAQERIRTEFVWGNQLNILKPWIE